MGKLNRYKYHIAATLILMSMLLMGTRTRNAKVSRSADELPRVTGSYQSEQQLELLVGAKPSLVQAASSGGDARAYILNYVSSQLSDDQAGNAFEIARAVILEAREQKMDPFFLLALITTESQFDITARGSHGEVGLMQILPRTAQALAKEAGLPEDFDLENPSINIRLGAIHLAHLRMAFKGRGHRYLAAYNMGSLNVRRLLKVNIEPQIYPDRVLGNYAQIYLGMHEVQPTTILRQVAGISAKLTH